MEDTAQRGLCAEMNAVYFYRVYMELILELLL